MMGLLWLLEGNELCCICICIIISLVRLGDWVEVTKLGNIYVTIFNCFHNIAARDL